MSGIVLYLPLSSKMSSFSPDDVSTDSLKCLWYGRFHPALSPNWMKFLLPLNAVLYNLILALAVKGVLVSVDKANMAECYQSCTLMIHGMAKSAVLYIYKSSISKLLEQKLKFWDFNDFQGEIRKECAGILNFAKKVIRTYYSWASIASAVFIFQPFVTGHLPTECYVPVGWYNLLTVVMWYLTFSFNLAITGTDGLFCSLGTSLTVQFKLLANKFHFEPNAIKEGSHIRFRMKEIVSYHNFLLSYSKLLNATFQPVFLVQFLVSIASGSLSVFIFMQPGDLVNRIKFTLLFFYTIAQTALYYVPLELTSIDIGSSVAISKWYEISYKQVKKSLIIVLAKTQQAVKFSAYGLVDVNLRTFVVICKTTFTFYTYLNSFKKISE